MKRPYLDAADCLGAAFVEACAVEENHAWENILGGSVDSAMAALYRADRLEKAVASSWDDLSEIMEEPEASAENLRDAVMRSIDRFREAMEEGMK